MRSQPLANYDLRQPQTNRGEPLAAALETGTACLPALGTLPNSAYTKGQLLLQLQQPTTAGCLLKTDIRGETDEGARSPLSSCPQPQQQQQQQQKGPHSSSQDSVEYFSLQLQDSASMASPAVMDPMPPPTRPAVYDRPRGLSNNSAVSSAPSTAGLTGYAAMTASRESFESRLSSAPSPWSSRTSFDSFDSIPSFHSAQAAGVGVGDVPTASSPYRHGLQRPTQLRQPRKKRKQGEQFAVLPAEVLELIMAELRKLHLELGSSSCATCWMRDCCSVALGSKKWLKFARVAL